MTTALTPEAVLAAMNLASNEMEASARVLRGALQRIEALEAELAACRRDAERYRHLRLWSARKRTPALYVSDGNNPIYGQFLDTEIDAAMAAQEKA